MIFNFEYIKEHFDSKYPESIAKLQSHVIENVKTSETILNSMNPQQALLSKPPHILS